MKGRVREGSLWLLDELVLTLLGGDELRVLELGELEVVVVGVVLCELPEEA